MNEFRTVVAVVLMLLAALVTIVNWACVIASGRNKRRGIDKHHSTVPLISFLLSGLAYEICPFAPKGWIGIIPAVDIGNWLFVFGLPWAIAKGAFRKQPPNKSTERDKPGPTG